MSSIFSNAIIKKTRSFKKLYNNINQTKFYSKNNATEEIMELVSMESKKFGTNMENIICELLDLQKRTSTQNDATFNGTKIEIKSARYWSGTNYDCKWQHIEKNHDYDVILFALLDFDKIKLWSIKKDIIFSDLFIQNKILTHQGKQGYWTKKSDILDHLTEIDTKDDFLEFIKDSKTFLEN